MLMERSRRGLVEAAARGDDAALAGLVKEYHERIYRFGVRVCRDRHDADDAVQEAFTKLARRPDVAADPGALSWLMSVVRNACRRMLRPFTSRRRVLGDEVPLAYVASDELDALAALERFELVHRVQSAIASLPETYREVLVLRDLEGLSGAEAAQLLGLELATMKSRLLRARAHLRESLRHS